MTHIESQKYNLDELIKAKYKSVHDIWYDPSAPNKNIDAVIKHTIIEAFREAAEEHHERRPQNIIFKLGVVGVGTAFAAVSFGGMTGMYQIPPQVLGADILAPIGGALFLAALFGGTDNQRTIFHQQLKDAEFGYPINPNARGNRKVYEEAVKKIDKFIATKRPDGLSRKSAADAPRQ